MDKEKLIDLCFNTKFKYEIPIYQRNYDWNFENCRQLFRDLCALTKSKNVKEHFFGSIITYMVPDTRVIQIVDGQQRIITVALLISAIRDEICKTKSKNSRLYVDLDDMLRKVDRISIEEDEDDEDEDDEDEDDEDEDDEDEDDEDEDDEGEDDEGEENNIYICPVKKDRAAYYAIINEEQENYIQTSNITINYVHFRNMILNSGITIKELYNAIKKLTVVELCLKPEDNVQEIFESINSTGLKLTEADKIRNLVLMNLKPKKQIKYHKKYWSIIESNVAGDLSLFFRHYLIAIKGQKVTTRDVYKEFKEVLEEYDTDTEYRQFLKQIKEYSMIYKSIQSSELKSPTSTLYMKYINCLQLTVAYPFIMRILYENRLDKIPDAEIDGAMAAIVNMLMRRTACGQWSTGLNSYFSSLYNAIIEMKTEENYTFSEKLKFHILNKSGVHEYKRDDEIKFHLANDLVYKNGDSKSIAALLSIIDGGRDKNDTIDSVIDNTLSIEHIMPQKLSSEWIKSLGDNYKEIHKNYLHKIGNLTLIAYNSDYSNRPFNGDTNNDKLTLKVNNIGKGFKYSGLSINESVKDKTKWGQEEIELRTPIIIEKFITNVPELKTNCKIIGKLTTTVSFDQDSDDFVGLDVKGYSFNGDVFSVNNGKEAYVSLIKLLYESNPNIMIKIMENIPKQMSRFFSSNEKNGFEMISDNIYVYHTTSQDNKAKVIGFLLDKYCVERENVSFFGIKKQDDKLE